MDLYGLVMDLRWLWEKGREKLSRALVLVEYSALTWILAIGNYTNSYEDDDRPTDRRPIHLEGKANRLRSEFRTCALSRRAAQMGSPDLKPSHARWTNALEQRITVWTVVFTSHYRASNGVIDSV